MELIALLFGALLLVGATFWLLLFGLAFLVELIWFVLMLPIRLGRLVGAIVLDLLSLVGWIASRTRRRDRSISASEVSTAEALGRAVGRGWRSWRNFIRSLLWILPR